MAPLRLATNLNRPPALHRPPQPPTAAQIYAAMPLWTIYYLFTVIMSNPRYENSLYGAWNMFLLGIFTQARHFAIIPQALIRAAITEEEDIDDDLGNISISSTGAVCHGRTKSE